VPSDLPPQLAALCDGGRLPLVEQVEAQAQPSGQLQARLPAAESAPAERMALKPTEAAGGRESGRGQLC